MLFLSLLIFSIYCIEPYIITVRSIEYSNILTCVIDVKTDSIELNYTDVGAYQRDNSNFNLRYRKENLSIGSISKLCAHLSNHHQDMIRIETNAVNFSTTVQDMINFSNYLAAFDKSYDLIESIIRLRIYLKNMQYIKKHNSEKKSYKMGLTRFTDWSYSEFVSYVSRGMSGFDTSRFDTFGYNTSGYNTSDCTNASIQNSSYDAVVDWRKKAVTPVQNQDDCGSCWAFSTIGATEGLIAIKTGNLTALSIQQLVDCSSAYGNDGCWGGLMDQAFRYTINNDGLCSETSYPYKGIQGLCQNQCSNVVGSNIKNCFNVPASREHSLGFYASKQPISVAIEADPQSFQHYVSGIYDDVTCYDGGLDHGVLVVGFNDKATTPYYIVKNSWGDDWGDKGYIYIARNPRGTGPGICGITMLASFPSY